ncbi:hypothetical protein J23TS9_50910 [Paenibacillus sp. J23TS9]|uniref:hypothetical protein n=1 Tax=Paenibacillus sp. J23TS9 TaxID=2807193 RepID=UPI001B2F6228|nr:hypothetical protein [Paenibacillus sp. J23TS9]GIP29961.1 hypothetical protein J23TS9_50910 [Paenibacillus sp. J23TS9]
MNKKWIPAIIIVICMILIACAAYFFRPYETKDPYPKGTVSSPAETKEQSGAEKTEVWINKDVTSIEWDGKRTSWILKQASKEENVADSGWTLNGEPITTDHVNMIISKMNAMLTKDSDSSRKASSLKAEVIDSTVTLLSGPDSSDKVYQIAVEPAYPETLWIVPAGKSMVYPVTLKDVQQLEKEIDQLKAASHAE